VDAGTTATPKGAAHVAVSAVVVVCSLALVFEVVPLPQLVLLIELVVAVLALAVVAAAVLVLAVEQLSCVPTVCEDGATDRLNPAPDK
jgi:hypothetical protein